MSASSESPSNPGDAPSDSPLSRWPQGQGARFFDGAALNQGCAAQVFGRPPSLSGLTVLQVVNPDAKLAGFLASLDKKTLRVECLAGDTVLLFKWASAYFDGRATKIQGVLESGTGV